MPETLEPYTDEELAGVWQAAKSGVHFKVDRLLATIEADRENLAEAQARISVLEKEREWRDIETCFEYDPKSAEKIWVLWPPDARSQNRRVELRLPDIGFWRHENEKYNAPMPMAWMPYWEPTPPVKGDG